jgi:hypothetical protein
MKRPNAGKFSALHVAVTFSRRVTVAYDKRDVIRLSG